jgi:hypothetical protein
MDPAQRVTDQGGGAMSYARFASMILTSTLLMFGLMYLNTFQASHAWFSETRAYMAVLMGAVMAMVMLGFMWKHYPRSPLRFGIIAVALIGFVGSLWLVRSQTTVGDVSWMKAMIPHHSIAILTSERARITDPRVRELADAIIETQRREIAQMEALIRDLESSDPDNRDPDNAPQRDSG